MVIHEAQRPQGGAVLLFGLEALRSLYLWYHEES
jgi:hypothetical protein